MKEKMILLPALFMAAALVYAGEPRVEPKSYKDEAQESSEAKEAAPAPAKPRRTWTNDDFKLAAKASAPEPTPVKPDPVIEKVPEPPAEEGKSMVPENAEERLKLITTLLTRQKAYDQTLQLMKVRLDEEPSAFRRELFQQILNDTKALSETNQKNLDKVIKAEKTAPRSATEPRP